MAWLVDTLDASVDNDYIHVVKGSHLLAREYLHVLEHQRRILLRRRGACCQYENRGCEYDQESHAEYLLPWILRCYFEVATLAFAPECQPPPKALMSATLAFKRRS